MFNFNHRHKMLPLNIGNILHDDIRNWNYM
jgi:hypothetical protein